MCNTLVKVCGIKSPEIGKCVYAAGGDAIGLVFAKSKRQLTLSEAVNISKDLPKDILKIGVFVNEPIESLMNYVNKVGLDIVQLHGDESKEYCEKIKLPVIKAFSIKERSDIEKAYEYRNLYGYLFDAKCEKYRGGEGKVFDWDMLKDLPTYIKDRLILAGGLNISNVEEAIREVNPFMIDVSSGVEINYNKDEALIKEFISLVKETK
ncbi:phosphoribosylanthranilate isomerase [Clostridium cylindrosporum]|uniref:N-(5'-phosphoribosyl)anthranilate isomerase n=1 Tax=Clostridium cylindrosporum DSM 605 TaxID=1121307 RepID=A0A0J8D417_CLOCY|nr:phosphoribosylanthranilate isomerase [Clostridium cylindrosporum]KMT20920.1 N-(5'-phosphoribosyl)anthranilate isomerase TrpF [Clostridium cylindrosporum DSM 605]